MTTIRSRIAEKWNTTDLRDPHDIADAILGDLDAKNVREALAEILPSHVSHVLSRMRGGFASAEEALAERPGLATGSATNQSASAQSSRSAKWSAASTLFRRPECVDGRHLQLGDLTVEDVGWLVEDRYRRAKDLTTAGDGYAALRDLMVRRKAKRVRDLPEDEVGEVLS